MMMMMIEYLLIELFRLIRSNSIQVMKVIYDEICICYLIFKFYDHGDDDSRISIYYIILDIDK